MPEDQAEAIIRMVKADDSREAEPEPTPPTDCLMPKPRPWWWAWRVFVFSVLAGFSLAVVGVWLRVE